MKDIELKKHPDTGELIPEEWREIDGYEGWYEVSNYGRVRSWVSGNYKTGWRRREAPRILRMRKSEGYPRVSLYKSGKKDFRVHTLVAKSFIPSPDNKPCVNHKDGTRDNNFYLNLEWCTYQENVDHARKYGLMDNRGENQTNSTLTTDDVLKIRKMYKEKNITHRELGEIFNVSHSQIGRVIRGKRWSHITTNIMPKNPARGSRMGSSKLTEEDVLKIRELYDSGECLQKEISEMFGVGPDNISRIVNRKTWTHI